MTVERAVTVALVALGVWGILVVGPILAVPEVDWWTYRNTIDRLLAGGPLYAPLQFAPHTMADAALEGGYVYPVTSLPLLPFTVLVWPWRLLNLAVLLAGTWAMTRRPLAVALMLAFPGTWATLSLGNAQPIVIGLYGFAYAGPTRWWAVAATAIKVWPVSLLVLAWKRKEPLRWAFVAVTGIAAAAYATGYLEVGLNAQPICGGYPIASLYCVSKPAALAMGALFGVVALAAKTDRACFAALCLSAFVIQPDWGWAYFLLPVMAVMPWLRNRSAPATDAFAPRMPRHVPASGFQ